MKLRLLYCLLFTMTFGLLNVQAQTQEDLISQEKPFKIGDEIDVKLRTVHPYQTLKAGVVFEQEFHSENSTYIKLYFRNFDLAPGDYVEIYSPETEESLIYAGKGKVVDNGTITISDFWSQVIFTDKVIVKLHAVQASKGHGFDLETVAYGYSPERIVELQAEQQRAICSGDEKELIACYDGTEMFNKAKAVCKLIMNGSGACTGWLLGCEGNVMTNNHCIGNASTARNTDFLFNFQTNTCNGGNTTTDVVASSATLIKTSNSVDATIVRLPVNPTNKYGYLSLRSAAARVGERIYIPQHPGARRKEIAVKDGNNFATIQSVTGSRDVQYTADTEGGSSGSPVLAYNSNLVVSIHNTGGCPNGSTGGNTRLISWLGSDLPRCGLNDPNNDDPNNDGDEVRFVKRNATGFAIDGGNGGQNGQSIELWSNINHPNLTWVEIDRGNGYYSYKKKNTNFCIDGGRGGANRQNVYLWKCGDNNQNQHWRKVNQGNGHYRLEKRNAPNFSIDGGRGGAKNQNVYLWQSNNNNQNQHWRFDSVNALEKTDTKYSEANLESSLHIEHEGIGTIKMTPNPTSDQFALHVHSKNTKNITVSIYTILGQRKYEGQLSSGVNNFSANNLSLSYGIYVVKIQSEGNKDVVKKLIIK